MEEDLRKYFRSLYEIASALNSARTLDGVLATLVESVVRALEAKGCSLKLLSPDRKTLLHVAAYGLSESYVHKGPVAADKSIAEALRGHPVAVLDADVDERIQYREKAREEGIASVLSVPMMLKEEIIGVVRVYTGERREFTEDEVFFVCAVANLGAVALENARFLESVQKDNETLRQELLQWGMTWVQAHRD
ncbi:MAG: GAF domain-containing protein [Chloroflexi bacterium]|nr:GAF domain-containing protein [Chloroflexota bacterium]